MADVATEDHPSRPVSFTRKRPARRAAASAKVGPLDDWMTTTGERSPLSNHRAPIIAVAADDYDDDDINNVNANAPISLPNELPLQQY